MATKIESEQNVETIKFVCSYGGNIILHHTDGNLRYVGGLTRVLSVHRYTSFFDLMTKLDDLCGYSVTMKCQLPNGDLETLISIKSNEELGNILDEYDQAAPGVKIRALLCRSKSLNKISSPSSSSLSPKSPFMFVDSPPSTHGPYIPRTNKYLTPSHYHLGVCTNSRRTREYSCRVEGKCPKFLHRYSRFNC